MSSQRSLCCTLHHWKHSFCHSKRQHSIWVSSTIHFTIWSLHKRYIFNSWFNTLMTSLVYTEKLSCNQGKQKTLKCGKRSTETEIWKWEEKLPISVQCFIDSRLRVLRPWAIGWLYPCDVRAIMGSRTTWASLSRCIWLPVSVARPKPRLTGNGPTNDVGSMLLMFLWQWCRSSALDVLVTVMQIIKCCHNFSPRIFAKWLNQLHNYSQDQDRLHTPCHAKRLC